MRFRPEQHVRRQRDFREAREKGRRLDCGGFTFWYFARQQPTEVLSPGALPFTGARVAVIASTAAVGKAHARNLAKRRLREVFRLHQAKVPAGFDLLLVARNALDRWEFTALEKKFTEACRRAFPASL